MILHLFPVLLGFCFGLIVLLARARLEIRNLRWKLNLGQQAQITGSDHVSEELMRFGQAAQKAGFSIEKFADQVCQRMLKRMR